MGSALPAPRVHRFGAPPCPTLTLLVYPGAEPWAPPPEILSQLACRMARPATVELVPRRLLPAIWSAHHDGRPLRVTAPHAFRAWSKDGRAVVLVDRTETPGSALWVLLHELAHLDVGAAPMLRSAYRSLPRSDQYLTSDEAHEAHPEEQLANLVATQTLAGLGLPAVSLDRLWWRERVKALTG